MNRTYYIWFLFFSAAVNGYAQVEYINTDRPDQSDGVYTTPRSKLQLENGVTIGKEVLLNNLMVRYGLTNSTEFRFLVDAGREGELNGLKPLTFSVKQRIIGQRGILPAVTFVGYLSVGRWASREFKGPKTPLKLELAFGNEISDRFSLGYNVAFSNHFKELGLTFGLGFSPNPNVSTFIEYFSNVNDQETQHNMDAGILFAVSPLLQFDVACALPLTHSDNPFLVTFGVAYLFY